MHKRIIEEANENANEPTSEPPSYYGSILKHSLKKFDQFGDIDSDQKLLGISEIFQDFNELNQKGFTSNSWDVIDQSNDVEQ
ncbi:uncharacterized protein ASCRUDRAFT_8840 [Ascoidea rubescens DSM 1968]|uniref:Uncharacterized protein n=1 Tax=Ascoidea rubescens DSM 1968 TaxID=1344418 RepID=A0A1D2VEL9_9ASCO|nr:hypothetical protein ASCRUDRAFT_8840 [Ascoidea rubescens DSM 1968]ODV60065.1 hypothetical protein ASCRUDRAFT_8840 [Ascoidea rubescens DSM 1968]